MVFEYYLNQFKKVKRASNVSLGKAPHKPILLLSVLQLIRTNEISSNKIFISPELVLAFKSNWNLYVETGHTSNFALPFFHMKSEPFWNLTFAHPKGNLIKSISTINVLKNFVLFAELDSRLFLLMQDEVQNILMEQELIRYYFPDVDSNYLQQTIQYQYQIRDEIVHEIFNEPSEVYQDRMKELENQLTEELIEEERFIRGGIFKKEIPRIYNNQCCISGMRIETTANAQMVDACHIKPFSISNDDTISNGICLSPNLHRAFDRGLLTVTEDFTVRISPTVIENESVFAIKPFEGTKISLPINPKHYPSPLNFKWHRTERFVV